MKTVAIVGTFDSKGEEFMYLARKIRSCGVEVLTIDAGSKRNRYKTDISNEEVAKYAGKSLESIGNDRAKAIKMMSNGLKICISKLYAEGKIDGIISMGGSGGTTLGSAAMSVLPVGFPKVLVSTAAASSKIFDFIDNSDVIIINPIVDVSGLNSVITRIYNEAAGAIAGAVLTAEKIKDDNDKLRIAASMYGVTTPGVSTAKSILEDRGYEVIVFHSTGAGGRVMEKLICEGFFDGVLDMTQTEIGMFVFGDRKASAGPERAAGAGKRGIPCISCLGALDMCSINSLPIEGKRLYYHNGERPTHFRPNVEESAAAGKFLAEQLNKSEVRQEVIIPLKGLSMMDVENGPTYGPDEDKALINSLMTNLHNSNITVAQYDMNINDEKFAIIVANHMDQLMQKRYRRG